MRINQLIAACFLFFLSSLAVADDTPAQRAVALANSSTEAFKAYDTPKAISICKEALKIDPDCSVAYFRLGAWYQDINRPIESIAAYDRAIATSDDWNNSEHCISTEQIDAKSGTDLITGSLADPSNDFKASFLLASRGQYWLVLGESAKAIADADEAVRRQPTYPYGYLMRAIIAIEVDDWTAADKSLTRASELGDCDATLAETIASIREDHARADQSLRRKKILLARAITGAEGNEPALTKLRAEWQALVHPQPVETPKPIVTEKPAEEPKAPEPPAVVEVPKPAEPTPAEKLATMYATASKADANNDIDAAIAGYTQVLELDKNCHEAQLRRAVLYLMKGDAEKSSADLASFTLVPLLAKVQNSGHTPTDAELQNFENGKQAIEKYITAGEHNRLDAVQRVMRTLRELGSPELGSKLIDDYIKQFPDDAEMLALRVEQNLSVPKDHRDLPQANADAERCCELEPTVAKHWLRLSRAKRLDGDQKNALVAIDNAIELDQEYADAYLDRCGMLLDDAAKARDIDLFNRAFDDAKKASELDPSSAEAWYRLAQIHNVRGEAREAFACADRMHKINPRMNVDLSYSDRVQRAALAKDLREALERAQAN